MEGVTEPVDAGPLSDPQADETEAVGSAEAGRRGERGADGGDTGSAHLSAAGSLLRNKIGPTPVGPRPSGSSASKSPPSESGHKPQHTRVSVWSLHLPALFRPMVVSSACKLSQNLENGPEALTEPRAKLHPPHSPPGCLGVPRHEGTTASASCPT